ncbi:hypothetical protein [Hyphomicrobium sp. CS1BSMeth3]|uniref:hypothetical protein n=1 Tax=Hyphomicrobium sp. CS1BSMeth3 TaxID=1892844 RepID=UPI000930ADF4|nr:hypothetical protein [Hyphomicrobium sp. CS1BSMeth3]
MAKFRIPKQTDRSLLMALFSIRDDINSLSAEHRILARTFEGHGSAELEINSLQEPPELAGEILAQESEVMSVFWLRSASNHNGLVIHRKGTEITDEVEIAANNEWYNNLNLKDERRKLLVIRLISSARKHLRAISADASMLGEGDAEWARYRASQGAILNSLQETQRTILSDFTRRSLEMEAAAKARIDAREAELEAHYNTLREQLEHERQSDKERLTAREQAIEERENSFNTKEARYVARRGQEQQIAQIKEWLNDWSLTKGTHSKRRVIIAAYVIGAATTGFAAYWFSTESMEILHASAPQLAWWQWLLLSIKSIFPFAAFVAIIIAFIRWSSDWAKQHADEEFRNRARILDIGRTSWLLEAVRDAQDNSKELPPDLVKELSRNLFAYSPTDTSELHPQAVSDMLMQGLNSLRVKGPDGSEIEAKRGKA